MSSQTNTIQKFLRILFSVMKEQTMFKKLCPCTLLGLALLTACSANSAQKTAEVRFSICNTADQPLDQVYIDGNYAGGGNEAHGQSGYACCSRIPIDQPVIVEWEMGMYYSDPKPMPSYKVSVPIKGKLQLDKVNNLGVYVNEKGQARVETKTSEEYLGPKGFCQGVDAGVKHE